MTFPGILALALLEILGIGVRPLAEGGLLAIGPETLVVGDVVHGAAGWPLVSWCRADAPPERSDTRCFVADLRSGGTLGRSRRPVFRTPGLCGGSRLRLSAVAGYVLGTTACSERSGLWAWAQLYDRGGRARTVPLPVAPSLGSEQTAPIPIAGPDGGAWVVWTEAMEGHGGRGTVRAIRLDPRGEPVGEAMDFSARDAAVTSGVETRFAVAGLPRGGLAVGWFERRTEGVAVRMGIFDARGRPAVPPVDLGSGAPRAFEPLRLATDTAGRITVTWWRDEPDVGGTRLYAASFSPRGAPLAAPAAVARVPTGMLPRIATVAASDGAQLLAWTDRDPDTGAPRIAVRRWSPQLGPLGLATWLEGKVTDRWAFLELIPGGAAGLFTLHWKETVDDPEQGLKAVLRWQELEVPNLATGPAPRSGVSRQGIGSSADGP